MSAPARSTGRGPETARGALLGALLLLAACDGGPTNPDGRAYPAQLAVAITLQAEAGGGGEGDAYDAATFIHILLTGSGGTILFDQTAPFSPHAETRVPVSVRVREETPARLDVVLLRGTSPLFSGTASLTLVPNAVAPAELTLVPVPASISVPETLEPLHSQGESAVLPGNVLFATGDVATSLHLQWVSLTPGVVSVRTEGTTSSVVAVRSGHGVLAAAYLPFTATVHIEVDIVPATVDIDPSPASLGVGETLQLTAVPRDALGNPVADATAAWSSLDAGIATVDETGLVHGVAKGTTTVRATVGAVTGDVTVEVVAPRPTVRTEAATGILVFTATLHATVSARGTPATAWFSYGTDPTLATASETPHVSIGSGEEEQSVSAEVVGLDPGTEYFFRAVAANDGGERDGDIASFTTLPLSAPVVTTLPPSPVASTTARLLANVDPRGTSTRVHFEWGTEPTLASPVVTPDQELGAGDPETEVEQAIGGLEPDAVTYYVRAVATNDAGTTLGDVVSFRTAPLPPSSFYAYYDGDYGEVLMSWAASESSITAYHVERSVLSATTSFGTIQTLGPTTTDSYESAPFAARTMYYRLRACNAFGCSDPSPVETVVVPDPAIYGILYVCYTPGTVDCFEPPSPVDVRLIGGPVSGSTKTGSFGDFYFDPLPPGSYTVRIDNVSCYFAIRGANEVSVTVGWGESRSLYFYSDAILCSPPRSSSGGSGGADGGATGGGVPPSPRAPGAAPLVEPRRR